MLLFSAGLVAYLALGVLLPHLSGSGPLGSLASDSRVGWTRLQVASWAWAAIAGVAILAGKSTRVGLLAAVALAAASMGALYEMARHSGAQADPSAAVGMAAFFGVSPSTNSDAVYATYAATLLVAVGLMILWRWVSARRRSHRLGGEIGHTEGATGPRMPDDTERSAASAKLSMARPKRERAMWIVLVISLLLVLVAFLPDLNALIASTKGQQYIPQFDASNNLAWTSFVARGLVPMKDFWYPYGNLLMFQSTLVGGAVLFFCYQAMAIFGYVWAFWKLSNGRPVVTCLAVLGLVLAIPLVNVAYSPITEFWRYGVAFMVSICFCVMRAADVRRARLWARLVFSFMVLIVAFVEIDLIAYAAIGALAALLFEILTRMWRPDRAPVELLGWRRWGTQLAADLVGPALAVGTFVIVSAVRGQLGNMIAFYLHPGTLEAYSAAPVSLIGGLSPYSLGVELVWLPAVALGGAVVLRWAGPDPRHALLSSMLVAVSGAGALLLLKNAVRPITPDLTLVMILIVLLGMVAASDRVLRAPRLVAPIALGLVAGLFAATVVIAGEAPALTTGVRTLPDRVVHDVATIIHQSPSDRATETARFDSLHFDAYHDQLDVAGAIKPSVGRSSTNLFVLGDEPVLYVLLHQLPPWETNLYNTSPIADQRHVVSWIRMHRPAVVVFAPATIDGVPSQVRVPLVFEEVVANYVPERVVDGYDILRRTFRGAKPSASFWVHRLGQVLELGAIPDLEAPLPAAGPDTTLTPVLRVRSIGAHPNGLVRIPLVFGHAFVTVEFRSSPARTTYEIPVNRLWPWALSHHVRVSGAITPGWSVVISRGFMPQGRLY